MQEVWTVEGLNRAQHNRPLDTWITGHLGTMIPAKGPGSAASATQKNPTRGRMTLFPIDKVGNMFDSKKRSIAKAASYRFFGSMVTASIAYFLTSKWEVALGIGLVDGVAKMAGYFLHERVWAHIKWGAPKRPDYEI